MNKYELKEDRGPANKQQGKMAPLAKWDIKKKELTSKRQLNLHTRNFHLGDVKKHCTTGII